MEQTRNDFRMLYSIHIDDIKYVKARQWAVTFYLLLVYPAIIGFSTVTDLKAKNALLEQKVLFLVVFLIATLGTFYLCDFQKRLSRYRKRIVKTSIGHKLSKDFADFEKEAGIDEPEGYTSFFNGFWGYTLPFILMLWIGEGFVFYYFFRVTSHEYVFGMQDCRHIRVWPYHTGLSRNDSLCDKVSSFN